MIKEAIEYIVGLREVKTFVENGQTYADKQVHLLAEPTAADIEVNSLSGLVEYVKSEFDSNKTLMIHVESQSKVSVFESLNANMNRNSLITARAMTPKFHFDEWNDPENFIIKLQSCFVKNDDRDIMLQVVGNIKEEVVSSVGDDGVSQSVVAKTGVASVSNVKVPNPVVLKPYRTFVEVDQPESDFIFRMKNGPRCALFEADGGAWKLQAMNNIKTYLVEALKEEIVAKKVIIIA